VLNSLNWWLSFRRNANFWDWVRGTYSDDDLRGLIEEATDCSLINPYDPFGDSSWNQFTFGEETRRKTVQRLMKRYGDEIWSCCLGAGDYDPDKGCVGLKCLSRLKLSFQVYNQATFEEFLVRNALKFAARQILEEGRKKKP
jgi:hypothetical protein